MSTTESQPAMQPSDDPTSVEQHRLKRLLAGVVALVILGPIGYGIVLYQFRGLSEVPDFLPGQSWWDSEIKTPWDAYYSALKTVMPVAGGIFLMLMIWKRASRYFGVPNFRTADEREWRILQGAMGPAFSVVFFMCWAGGLFLRIDYCSWMATVAMVVWVGGAIRESRRDLTGDDS